MKINRLSKHFSVVASVSYYCSLRFLWEEVNRIDLDFLHIHFCCDSEWHQVGSTGDSFATIVLVTPPKTAGMCLLHPSRADKFPSFNPAKSDSPYKGSTYVQSQELNGKIEIQSITQTLSYRKTGIMSVLFTLVAQDSAWHIRAAEQVSAECNCSGTITTSFQSYKTKCLSRKIGSAYCEKANFSFTQKAIFIAAQLQDHK